MFSEPEKNLKKLGIEENMVVADLGAGSGFYTMLLAKMTPFGKVYAVEIQQDFLKTVRNKVSDLGLTNVECFWGDIEKIGGTKIADKVVDRVIASNVFSQLGSIDNTALEIRRIIKDQGKVLVIDWLENSFVMTKKHKSFPGRFAVTEAFKKNGLSVDKEIDVGEHHYGIIFKVDER